MVLWLFWMLNQELNLRQKPFEDKQLTTVFQELFLLTKWIKLEQILKKQLFQLENYLVVIVFLFNEILEKKVIIQVI